MSFFPYKYNKRVVSTFHYVLAESPKGETGKSPLKLVYGLDVDVVFPMNLRLPMYKLLDQFTTNQDALQSHVHHVTQLDEDRRVAYEHFMDYQSHVKKVFEHKARDRAL